MKKNRPNCRGCSSVLPCSHKGFWCLVSLFQWKQLIIPGNWLCRVASRCLYFLVSKVFALPLRSVSQKHARQEGYQSLNEGVKQPLFRTGSQTVHHIFWNVDWLFSEISCLQDFVARQLIMQEGKQGRVSDASSLLYIMIHCCLHVSVIGWSRDKVRTSPETRTNSLSSLCATTKMGIVVSRCLISSGLNPRSNMGLICLLDIVTDYNTSPHSGNATHERHIPTEVWFAWPLSVLSLGWQLNLQTLIL